MKRIPRHSHAKRLKRGHLVIRIYGFCTVFAKTTIKGITIRKINPPFTGPTYFLHSASLDVRMDGYGGQTIIIDFDENRIIAISTVHTDYDFERIVLKPLKNGAIN